jgi:hypothetical protein
MNSEERQLISGLFDRMREFGSVEKDRDAEALIRESVRQIPDASYMLVQSVLVQEQTLQQAGQRIEELEARVRELEARTARGQSQGSGSFLGGLFGGGSQPPAPRPMPRSSSGFGQPAAGAGGAPAGGPAGPWGQPAQRAGGGGFLQSAMATAAGVAGGVLLANSLQGMFGGGSSAKAGEQAQPAEQAQYQDPNDNDPGNYDETQDAGHDDTGGDWGGGDLDI